MIRKKVRDPWPCVQPILNLATQDFPVDLPRCFEERLHGSHAAAIDR